MKRLLALLLTGSLVLSLAACGSSSSSSSEDSSDSTSEETADESEEAAEETTETADGQTVVHVAIGGSVTELGPHASTNEFVEPIHNTLYETLFVTESVSSAELVPVIGKSVEWLDDYTTQIEIYDYVHDADGNEITASDIVYSYEVAIEVGYTTSTSYIESITAVDDYTIQLTLNDINETKMNDLLTHILIVDEEADTANPDSPPGTTAYKLTSYISGAEYVCEKTGDYWQTDESLIAYSSEANVDKLVFEIITESAQTTTALENGEVQMAIGVDGREASRFEEGGEDEEGFSVDTYPGNFTLVLLFNCTDESLASDVNFRKACLYAINRESLVDVVLYGAGVVASDMASSALRGFNEEWLEEDYFGYDLELAQEYLEASGYNGETIRLEGSNSYSSELEFMQAQLNAIGINSEIQTFENALWQDEKVAGTGDSSWDICVDGLGGSVVTSAWSVKFDPANFSTGAAQTGILDETLDELLDTAITSQDADDIEAVHDYIVEQAYAIGLYASATKCVTVDTISDIVYSHKGYVIPAAANYDNYTVTE